MVYTLTVCATCLHSNQCLNVIKHCVCRESAHTHVDNNLPFELKALEAALTHAVTIMEEDAVQLNKQVSPILESLSYKVLSPCACAYTHIQHIPTHNYSCHVSGAGQLHASSIVRTVQMCLLVGSSAFVKPQPARCIFHFADLLCYASMHKHAVRILAVAYAALF